jgi:hypothetical protein
MQDIAGTFSQATAHGSPIPMVSLGNRVLLAAVVSVSLAGEAQL